MGEETYHLIDREVLLHRLKQVSNFERFQEIPERDFILGLLESSKRIHKPQQNYHVELVIRSCEEGRDGIWDCSTNEGKEGFNDMISILNDLKI